MTKIKENPIVFSDMLIKAILDGTKTQSRQPMIPQPPDNPTGRWSFIASSSDRKLINHFSFSVLDDNGFTFTERGKETRKLYRSPYGLEGDRLWVRETWRPCAVPQCSDSQCVEYMGSGYCQMGHLTALNRHDRWRAATQMPRRAARLILQVNEIRVERLHDISEKDAKAEGTPALRTTLSKAIGSEQGACSALDNFQGLWNQIHGERSWAKNPWVWVIKFRRLPPQE